VSTETKVKKLVKDLLPKGKAFQLRWQPVGFGGYRVLRVVTPAWRSLPRFQRILKLQSAITGGLSAKERANILRVSVLTAAEYKKLHPATLTHRSRLTRTRRATNGR
jgi:hypothetical protein